MFLRLFNGNALEPIPSVRQVAARSNAKIAFSSANREMHFEYSTGEKRRSGSRSGCGFIWRS